MEYISSDTTVWIDFSVINRTNLPFLLLYTYIMSNDAVHDELISPPGLGKELVSLGLVPVEITIEEFELAQSYGVAYRRLSVHDRVALAIAKKRGIGFQIPWIVTFPHCQHIGFPGWRNCLNLQDGD